MKVEKLQDFLKPLYRKSSGFIELRVMDRDYRLKYRKWIPIHKATQIGRIADKYRSGHHIFFGVCTRSKQSKDQGKALKEGCFLNHFPCLWADLDWADYPEGRGETIEVINDFPLPVSSVVSTGHGFHAYWYLDRPVKIEKGNIKWLEYLLHVLQQDELLSDQVSDLTRVLRLPGSLNIKDPSHPKPVTITALYPGRKYNIRDFEDELGLKQGNFTYRQGSDASTGHKLTSGVSVSAHQGIDIDGLLVSDWIKELIKVGREGKKMFRAKYKSRSEADQAVICSLLQNGYPEEIIFQIFKEHPAGIGAKYLDKEKAGDQYLKHSIRSAKDFLTRKQASKSR